MKDVSILWAQFIPALWLLGSSHNVGPSLSGRELVYTLLLTGALLLDVFREHCYALSVARCCNGLLITTYSF